MLGSDFLLKEEWMKRGLGKALKRVGPILAIAVAGSALSLFAAGPRLASADDPHNGDHGNSASADNSHGANANAHDNNSPNDNVGGNPSNNGVGNGGSPASPGNTQV